MESNNTRIKFIKIDDFSDEIKKYYPMLRTGINEENCNILFYDYDNNYWSEGQKIINQLIKKYCGITR